MTDAELVKSRLDIVELVAGYVELKKAGKDYRAVSPFRQERTPSFFVSPEKQIWHDFGSNEGGDIISFVMRAEGMSFPEALEFLADKAGVELSRQPGSSQQRGEKQDLYRLVEEAYKFYHLQLSKSPEALGYIKDKRGLSAETIKRYKLGYAPAGWSVFTDYALSKKFTLKQLKTAGLSGIRKEGNSGFDLFRDRIMFPVFDAQGRALGFSGRLLGEAKAAKYINSPETPIYHKSQAIFGLYQARPSIRQEDSVVLVEGHVDALSLAQHGQTNVVAISGTALTLDQLQLLSRQASVLRLCFDADNAGQKATERAIMLGLDLKSRLEVVSYTQTGAKDPDELIHQDPGSWKKIVESAQYGLDYLFQTALQASPPESAPAKKAFVARLMPVLRQLPDRVEQEHYINQVAGAVGVEPELIRDQVKRSATAKRQAGPTTPQSTSPEPETSAPVRPQSRQEELEQMLLELLLAYPETRMVLGEVDPASDISEANRALFEALVASPQADLKVLIKRLPDLEERVKILALRGEHEYSAMTEHERGLEAFTQVHTVQKHIVTQKKRALSRRIAVAEQTGNSSEAQELLRQYQALVSDETAF